MNEQELAKAALLFLNRTTMSPQEIAAFQEVASWLSGIAQKTENEEGGES